MNKILWNRFLSCGHIRPTNIFYMIGDYTEPKVGATCYCRECMKDTTIIKVEKANEE